MNEQDKLVEELFNLTMSDDSSNWELYYSISEGLGIRNEVVKYFEFKINEYVPLLTEEILNIDTTDPYQFYGCFTGLPFNCAILMEINCKNSSTWRINIRKPFSLKYDLHTSHAWDDEFTKAIETIHSVKELLLNKP